MAFHQYHGKHYGVIETKPRKVCSKSNGTYHLFCIVYLVADATSSIQESSTLNPPSSASLAVIDSCSPLTQNDLPRASSPISVASSSSSELNDFSLASPLNDTFSLHELSPISSLNNLPHTSSLCELSSTSSLDDFSSEVSVSPASSLNDLPCEPSPNVLLPQSTSEPPSFTFPHQSFNDPKFFSPLYPNADVTLCGAMCAIMQFATANKLTYAAIEGLLKLLILPCPCPNQLPTNFYKFKNFFKQFSATHDHKKVCTKCMQIECSCDKSTSSDLADLINLDIHKPLETVIARK